MKRLTLVLAAMLLPWIAAADATADSNAAERLEAALGGLDGMKAEFRQTVTDCERRAHRSRPRAPLRLRGPAASVGTIACRRS